MLSHHWICRGHPVRAAHRPRGRDVRSGSCWPRPSWMWSARGASVAVVSARAGDDPLGLRQGEPGVDGRDPSRRLDRVSGDVRGVLGCGPGGDACLTLWPLSMAVRREPVGCGRGPRAESLLAQGAGSPSASLLTVRPALGAVWACVTSVRSWVSLPGCRSTRVRAVVEEKAQGVAEEGGGRRRPVPRRRVRPARFRQGRRSGGAGLPALRAGPSGFADDGEVGLAVCPAPRAGARRR